MICCSLWREWEGRKVQWLEVSTRGQAKGGASTQRPWLSSQGTAPAWESGSQRSTRLLHGATRTCQSTPPTGPKVSAWWCVSNRLHTTTVRQIATGIFQVQAHNNEVINPVNIYYLFLKMISLNIFTVLSQMYFQNRHFLWIVINGIFYTSTSLSIKTDYFFSCFNRYVQIV